MSCNLIFLKSIYYKSIHIFALVCRLRNTQHTMPAFPEQKPSFCSNTNTIRTLRYAENCRLPAPEVYEFNKVEFLIGRDHGFMSESYLCTFMNKYRILFPGYHAL